MPKAAAGGRLLLGELHMPRLSCAFFTLAALCGLGGMIWGLWMGANQDFATHPAHAHLNLVGWLSLAVMGTFYTLDRAAVSKLGWANFVLSATGAIVLPIGIASIALGHEATGGASAMVGGLAAFLGMALFVLSVIGSWRRAS
jgi:hypothetical protein